MNSPDGEVFEIDPDDEIVWKYVCPVLRARAGAQQGETGTNRVFRAHRYAPRPRRRSTDGSLRPATSDRALRPAAARGRRGPAARRR